MVGLINKSILKKGNLEKRTNFKKKIFITRLELNNSGLKII